ncbi:MAG TPA: primosomal protein N' [Oligoflexia bacterium]|nr:primosomal protein N' [Oligoflexia bacterium]HMR25025.1 primosomal protein N' [Oligoflexia bacterium]
MTPVVDIALTLPLDQTYTYKVPEGFSPQLGQRVLVPFQNRTLTGFVFSSVRQMDPDPNNSKRYKNIHSILDQHALLNEEQIELVHYLSQYYGASLGESLNTVLPPGLLKQSKRKIVVVAQESAHTDTKINAVWQNLFGRSTLDYQHFLRQHPKSQSLLNKLAQEGWIRIESLLQNSTAIEHYESYYSLSKNVSVIGRLGKNQKKLLDLFLHDNVIISKSDLAHVDLKLTQTAKDLVKKGILLEEKSLKDLNSHDVFLHAPQHTLNPEQQHAVEQINKAILGQQAQEFLLYGPTGSGKTEVYLNCAQTALSQGKTVLALVPEIALTPQFIGRFRARFADQVAVLHSALNASERLTQWQRIVQGEAKVVIGARSAIFSPLKNIGLLILDEEHDSSYKQHEGLKYHCKHLAQVRTQKQHAVLLLGSATPSMESYFTSTLDQSKCLTLLNRAHKHSQLADTEIVNIKQEFKSFAEKGLISEKLKHALQETLEKGQQSVVFLNRRGFAPIILCTSCGESQKCPHCSVALTYHKSSQSYECHYCGFSKPKQSRCGHCQQGKVIHLGLGTEAVEQELKRYFPDANIARMDRDILKKKNAHKDLLQQLAYGQIDILVGTQMVTKGLDIENVTLVGVLLADQSLHFPDFRAAETTFALLTQVIGRSGRGQFKGKALIQTMQPDHYAIKHAMQQDYAAFYAQEIQFRQELAYPPFEQMALFNFSSKDERLCQQTAQWLAKQATAWQKNLKLELSFLGPAPSPLKKIKDVYRYQFLLKGKDKTILHDFVLKLHHAAKQALATNKKVNIHMDIDPYHFL